MDNKSTLQQAVLEALENGKSQNALARKMGVSAATVINIKKGHWENISEEMINKLLAFFRIDSWKIMETWNYKAIHGVCSDAMVNKRFLAIAGYTGAGKSTALREFAKKYEDVYYMHATSVMNKKLFLGAIQASMGIRDGYSVPMMMDAIIAHMNSANQPLLIIDDAGKLSPSIMGLIQIIYDGTETRAGIVMAGTEYLEEIITKWVRYNRMGFRELFRRIGFWQPLRQPTIAVVQGICAQYGITEKSCIRYIHEHAHNYGDIRNIIVNALQVKETSGQDIDREMLESLNVGKHFYNMNKI
jgi:DNA transposition AAA+ family ATPase